ncbi:hypothetical protein PRUPE_1G433400 [Prunus persica]|uniref:Uncharacterized protein n=1 Tax=Prunus persica TaxID=3760 RepID=A0A251RC12_PRUPE|nr:hypothetical protein PRUPE_1G433400 [Prunus persica]
MKMLLSLPLSNVALKTLLFDVALALLFHVALFSSSVVLYSLTHSRYESKKAFVDITDGDVAFRDNVWLHNFCAYDIQNEEKSIAYINGSAWNCGCLFIYVI